MEELVYRSVSKHGVQTVRKTHANTKANTINKALERYGHIRYFGVKPKAEEVKQFVKPKLKKMDLMTAIARAKEASKKDKKPYYITLDNKTAECDVSTAPIGNATHKFVDGVEDKDYANRKTVKADLPKKELAPKETLKTKEMKTKKAAKGKKPAAKKEPVKVAGEKKTLKIKQIVELMNKGTGVYRQSTGGKLSIVHMKAAKNKEHELAVIVVKK